MEFLRQANVSVLTRQSVYDPKFHFAYTALNSDSKHDTNWQFHNLGVMDLVMTQITYHVLHDVCKKPGGGMMVDVGAGSGWFSILAGMLGCRLGPMLNVCSRLSLRCDLAAEQQTGHISRLSTKQVTPNNFAQQYTA